MNIKREIELILKQSELIRKENERFKNEMDLLKVLEHSNRFEELLRSDQSEYTTL